MRGSCFLGMIFALFWDCMQLKLVINDVSGQPSGPIVIRSRRLGMTCPTEEHVSAEIRTLLLRNDRRFTTCVSFMTESQGALRRATRPVLTLVAKWIDVDGGIFENLLYKVNCTNFDVSLTVHHAMILGNCPT